MAGQLTGGDPNATITSAQASTLSPEQAQVQDAISGFYAEHPTLVKTLGSSALSIALAKMVEHSRGRRAMGAHGHAGRHLSCPSRYGRCQYCPGVRL